MFYQKIYTVIYRCVKQPDNCDLHFPVLYTVYLKLCIHYFGRLKIREAILRGTEAYYDSQDNKASSFITDYKKAKDRNVMLLQVCDW